MNEVIITGIMGIIGVFLSGVGIGIAYTSHEYTKEIIKKIEEEIDYEIQSK